MNSVSYRQITFGAYSSFDDFGAYIGSEVDTDTKIERAKPRTLRETIPFMNGSYNFSTLGGKIVYDDRIIRYTFIVSGISRADVEAKIIALDGWLGDVTETELIDTDFPGWKFINVSYNGMNAPQFYSNNETMARVTAEFTAGPYMQSATGVVVNCLDIIPNDISTKYLFTSWRVPSQYSRLYYILSRIVAPGGGTVPGISVSFTTASTSSSSKVAVVTLSASSTAPTYILMAKSMGGVSVSAGQTSGCTLIKETDDYYYYLRTAGFAMTVHVWGFDYSSYTESQVSAIITHGSSWLYQTGQQSFLYDSIPDTQNMRVVSEGDPVVFVEGNSVDESRFPLNINDLIVIDNAKSVVCKLQYCTIREQR